MKTVRFLISLVIAMLVFSVWTPSPAYAKNTVPSNTNTFLAGKSKTATLTIDNRTGGTIYIRLTGPRSYYFVASKPGKNTFTGIEFGVYTVTHNTSACKGVITKKLKVTGNVNLGHWSCN
jgi:hypothetical protein